MLGFLVKKKTREKNNKDRYQESLDTFGKEQLKRLVEKGMHIPIAVF